MTETPDEKMLDELFAEAREQTPMAGDAFLARIEADAAAVAARWADRPVHPRRRGPLRAFVAALAGGWAGLGGLAVATAAGLWIGLAPPTVVQELAPGLYGTTVSVPFTLEQSALWPEDDA